MNLIPAAAEILLFLLAIFVMLLDLFLPHRFRHVTSSLSLASLLACGIASLCLFLSGGTVHTFQGAFVSDPLANLLKLAACLVTLATLVYSRRYVDEHHLAHRWWGGDLHILALFSLLGQMVLISSAHFLSLYLGMELMLLPLYALLALRRDATVTLEAAVKYFILGVLGSGFLLYGISLLYGATGTLSLREMARVCLSGGINHTLLVPGLVLLVAGVALKLGAVPFHMWVPDVYEGAPPVVTLLIAGAPRIAIFALCFRVLAEALAPLSASWQTIVLLISLLSMALGNGVALLQNNICRLLGYSAIAQMGFMLLGFLPDMPPSGSADAMLNAYGAALFYMLVYVIAVLCAFGVIILLSRADRERVTLDDFRGLGRTHPGYAFALSLSMLSLAGVPPLAGFYAKLGVLEAVIASGRVWVAVAAVIFAVIGAFYYLRVIRRMYFDPAANDAAGQESGALLPSRAVGLLLGVNALLLLVFGILPGSLLHFCTDAIAQALLL
ncbi:MAG: NADH-quinone oxidoreductase subunit NuoN [Burkholderiaceae bacterium]|jgi:NADH-quinone oxidoreductase subunit N|nr:NADH-quinone oxidoreductase subunit NuoN [Burkholderiaceae bacterium]